MPPLQGVRANHSDTGPASGQIYFYAYTVFDMTHQFMVSSRFIMEPIDHFGKLFRGIELLPPVEGDPNGSDVVSKADPEGAKQVSEMYNFLPPPEMSMLELLVISNCMLSCLACATMALIRFVWPSILVDSMLLIKSLVTIGVCTPLAWVLLFLMVYFYANVIKK